VTKIDAEFPADSFFPNLDADPDWVAAQETEIQQEADLRFRFVTYKRNR
jgi:dihydrofolate reductase